jgi:hypothetical protein
VNRPPTIRLLVVALPIVLATVAAAAFHATARRGSDPWGRPWIGPPSALRNLRLPVYSAGPDGVDDSEIYFDTAGRLDAATDRLLAHFARDHTRTKSSGGSTCVVCSALWAAAAQVTKDALDRAAAGLAGDDVLFRGCPDPDDVLSEDSALEHCLRRHARVEPWIVGLALSLFLAASPRAPRSRSPAREATRVLLLAIGPATVFLVVGHVALDAVKPAFPALIVSPGVALTTTSVLASLVLALSVRPPPRPESDIVPSPNERPRAP